MLTLNMTSKYYATKEWESRRLINLRFHLKNIYHKYQESNLIIYIYIYDMQIQ